MLVTPVLDVKRICGRSIAIVDGTVFSVNPLRSTSKPVLLRIPAMTATQAPAVHPPVAVYGNSCMETDFLAEVGDIALAVGDLLIFAQKGAYADSMAAPFSQGIPALVSLHADNHLSLERERNDIALLNDRDQGHKP